MSRLLSLGPEDSPQEQNDLLLAWKEEAERAELFKLVDINHNGMVSLAEVDKAPC